MLNWVLGTAQCAVVGWVNTQMQLTWVQGDTVANSISCSATNEIRVFSTPASALVNVSREDRILVPTTLAIYSFFYSGAKVVLGLEACYIQESMTANNLSWVRQSRVAGCNTLVTSLLSRNGVHYGLNNGFVQSMSPTSLSAVVFQFSGLPVWFGLYLDSIVLHTDGAVLLYNLSTATLHKFAVPLESSGYNHIANEKLYLVSGRQLCIFSLSARTVVETYSYEYNLYAVSVQSANDDILLLSFATSTFNLGFFYRNLSLAFYAGFRTQPKLITFGTRFIAYSQEGNLAVIQACPTQSSLVTLQGGLCLPCYKAFPNCSQCSKKECLDSQVAAFRSTQICPLFNEYCLYQCPQGYFSTQDYKCKGSQNFQDYAVSYLFIALRNQTHVSLVLASNRKYELDPPVSFSVTMLTEAIEQAVTASPRLLSPVLLELTFALNSSSRLRSSLLKVNSSRNLSGFNSSTVFSRVFLDNKPTSTFDLAAGYLFGAIFLLAYFWLVLQYEKDATLLLPLQLFAFIRLDSPYQTPGTIFNIHLSNLLLVRYNTQFVFYPIQTEGRVVCSNVVLPSGHLLPTLSLALLAFALLLAVSHLDRLSIRQQRNAFLTLRTLVELTQLPLLCEGFRLLLNPDRLAFTVSLTLTAQFPFAMAGLLLPFLSRVAIFLIERKPATPSIKFFSLKLFTALLLGWNLTPTRVLTIAALMAVYCIAAQQQWSSKVNYLFIGQSTLGVCLAISGLLQSDAYYFVIFLTIAQIYFTYQRLTVFSRERETRPEQELPSMENIFAQEDLKLKTEKKGNLPSQGESRQVRNEFSGGRTGREMQQITVSDPQYVRSLNILINL